MVYKINLGEHPIIDAITTFLEDNIDIAVFLKSGEHFTVNGECNLEIMKNNFIKFTIGNEKKMYGIFNLNEIIGVTNYGDY